jgi:hypothetical protein
VGNPGLSFFLRSAAIVTTQAQGRVRGDESVFHGHVQDLPQEPHDLDGRASAQALIDFVRKELPDSILGDLGQAQFPSAGKR